MSDSDSGDAEYDSGSEGASGWNNWFKRQSREQRRTALRLSRLAQSASPADLDRLRRLLKSLSATSISPDVVDSLGRTPLMTAVNVNNFNSTACLLAAGASPSVVDPNEGVSPLHSAVAHKDVGILRLLLAAGADINAGSVVTGGADLSRTPLMLAAVLDNATAVRALLAYGAGHSVRTGGEGWTAEDLAAMHHAKGAVAVLRKWESMPDAELKQILLDEEKLMKQALKALESEESQLQPQSGQVTDAIATSLPAAEEEENETRPSRNAGRRPRPQTAKTRGRCLVINVNNYDEGSGFDGRAGSEHDVKIINKVFRKLRFLVTVEEDLTGSEINRCVTEFAWRCHSNYDCFVCFLMAHGAEGVIFGRDGVQQNIKELTAPFQSNNCPSLLGKPKIFFVQACRHRIVPDSPVDSGPPSGLGLTSPVADFLFCYANTEDLPAFRDPDKGSAFVQTLCSVLNERSRQDHLADLLTTVNQRMQANPVRDLSGRLFYPPVLEVVTRLSGKIWLHPDSV